MRNILILLLLSSIAACAPTHTIPPKQYYDPTKDADYMPPNPAVVRCRYEAFLAGQNARGGWLYQGAVEQQAMQLCREAAGL